ncbi:hypothetical protein TNCV_1140831 [Trichonephila clavipes]|nr:hypothetical protein TNCV_1140831 [Trichonephila clavipes]
MRKWRLRTCLNNNYEMDSTCQQERNREVAEEFLSMEKKVKRNDDDDRMNMIIMMMVVGGSREPHNMVTPAHYQLPFPTFCHVLRTSISFPYRRTLGMIG